MTKIEITAASYKCEVQADDSGKWYGNAVRYATKEKAEIGARDLMSRWMAVRDWRVIESEDKPNR